MSGLLGYLSMLYDDMSFLVRSVSTTTKSLSFSIDDIITYTKITSVKTTGIVIDDLAVMSSFINEITSDTFKKELLKAKNIDGFKQNIKKLPKQEQKKILDDLENIKQKVIFEVIKKASKRELPIVYKIALGSLKNKLIIIPIVLIMSFFFPFLISPMLILGGSYLAFEGVENIIEAKKEDENKGALNPLPFSQVESKKIKDAIKTDFILSFEIIVITLSFVENSHFITKLSVLLMTGFIATIFVYGVVGFIIKIDDMGFYLQRKKSKVAKNIGDLFVKSMPIIIKVIFIIGTIALLWVGGGIIFRETHMLDTLKIDINTLPYINGILIFLMEIILGFIVGFIIIKINSFFSFFKRDNSS